MTDLDFQNFEPLLYRVQTRFFLHQVTKLLFRVKRRGEAVEIDAVDNSFRRVYASMMELTRENGCTCFESDTADIYDTSHSVFSLDATIYRCELIIFEAFALFDVTSLFGWLPYKRYPRSSTLIILN